MVKYVQPVTLSKFQLEDNAFGDLHGIPGKCVNMDTGDDVMCGPGDNIRWIPKFSIPDGSTVTSVNNGGAEYLVKALEKEQRMKKETDPSLCSGLNVSGFTLPGMFDWIDPDIGAIPEVTAAPAVNGGVLQ